MTYKYSYEKDKHFFSAQKYPHFAQKSLKLLFLQNFPGFHFIFNCSDSLHIWTNFFPWQNLWDTSNPIGHISQAPCTKQSNRNDAGNSFFNNTHFEFKLLHTHTRPEWEGTYFVTVWSTYNIKVLSWIICTLLFKVPFLAILGGWKRKNWFITKLWN